MKSRLFKWTWKIIDLVYPSQCAGCGENGIRWCNDCQKKLVLVERNTCSKCGEPLKTEGREICLRCATGVTYFQQLKSYAVYQDPLKSAIQQFKYKRNLGLGEIFAGDLMDILKKSNWQIDLIVPVPLSKTRIRERGYNQALVLARPLGWKMEIPVQENLLVRHRDTKPQVGLSLAEREQNLQDAFRTKDSGCIAGKNILIVDDVITSGSTMNACAKAFHEAGAGAVYGVSLARAI